MALYENDIEVLLHDQDIFSALLAEGVDRKKSSTGPGFNASAAGLQDKNFALQVQSWIALLENVARKSATVVQEKSFSEGIQ